MRGELQRESICGLAEEEFGDFGVGVAGIVSDDGGPDGVGFGGMAGVLLDETQLKFGVDGGGFVGFEFDAATEGGFGEGGFPAPVGFREIKMSEGAERSVGDNLPTGGDGGIAFDGVGIVEALKFAQEGKSFLVDGTGEKLLAEVGFCLDLEEAAS